MIQTKTIYEARLLVREGDWNGEYLVVQDSSDSSEPVIVIGDNFQQVLEQAVEIIRDEEGPVALNRLYIAVITTTCVPFSALDPGEPKDKLEWIKRYRALTGTDYRTAEEAYDGHE
jgi:hypothetical protein